MLTTFPQPISLIRIVVFLLISRCKVTKISTTSKEITGNFRLNVWKCREK